jgi:hypothetical protein
MSRGLFRLVGVWSGCWVVRLVEIYQTFGGIYFLLLRGSWMENSCKMKTETAGSLETSVNFIKSWNQT